MDIETLLGSKAILKDAYPRQDKNVVFCRVVDLSMKCDTAPVMGLEVIQHCLGRSCEREPI